MPIDATEMTLKSTETGSGISLSGGETVTGMDMEHIYIGDEFADNSNEPTQVSKCESIRNCVNGTLTELTFFEEGFLKVREGNNKKRNVETCVTESPPTNRSVPDLCLEFLGRIL